MANSPTQESFPVVSVCIAFFLHAVVFRPAALARCLVDFNGRLRRAQTLLDQIGQLAGSKARTTAAAVYASAHQHPSIGTFAGIVGIVISVVGATTVFAQLQASLNLIWGGRIRVTQSGDGCTGVCCPSE